jgi:hypothetical protein
VTGLLGGLKVSSVSKIALDSTNTLRKKSLLNAKILQRDISIGNIVLNKDEDDAFLTDLDLVIKTDRQQPSGALSKTGTKVFMASTLYGEDHNFMHGLESFFWLLVWFCAHWNGPDQKRGKTGYES